MGNKIDLVKDFYAQDIDFKSLLSAKKAAKKVTNYSLNTFSGAFGEAEKRHLLNRALIGNAKRHMDDLDNLSLEQSLSLLFTTEEIGEPINDYYYKMNAQQYQERYGSEDVAPGAPFISRAYNRDLPPGSEEQFGGERNGAIRTWLHNAMFNQNTSIHWKLFLFLHNLVPTTAFDMFGHKTAYNYTKLLFDSCFGSYKQFIYDITIDSSMLIYLNLYLSQKETPDENYAREVQELFTVGKRPFAQFSESDVREIARALVGWNTDYDSLVYEEGHEETSWFQDWNHDTGDKFFSEFYNNTVIRGRSGQEGEEELAEVIDMLFETDESCIYIARRLYQFFVYPNLTDEIESQIIRPLADVFRNSNFSLVETLKVLLKSEHFFDAGNRNNLILPPYEFAFKLMKEVSIFGGNLVHWDGNTLHDEISDPNYFPEALKDQTTLSARVWDNIRWHVSNLGMEILEPPSVSGWPAYYQAPVYDLFWINTNTLKSRKQLAQSVLQWGIWLNYDIGGNSVNLNFNCLDFIREFENPYNLDAFIDELNKRFLVDDMSQITKDRIKRAFLNGIDENHWEEEMRIIITDNLNPFLTGIQNKITNGLSLYSMLGEFHLH